MKDSQIILNTIVFKEQLDKGYLQAELLPKIKEVGVNIVEIRREYIKDFKTELLILKEKSKALGMTLFYSVNDEVIIKNKVNPMLQKYINELKEMGGVAVKFNVGNFINYQGDLSKDLRPLLDETYVFTVENNQLLTHSNLKNINNFMCQIKEHKLPISFVFDLANWYWVNEDPIQAAKFLDNQTRYVHLKNFVITDNELVTVPLLNGAMEWQRVLDQLHFIEFIGLEFQATNKELMDTLEKINNL